MTHNTRSARSRALQKLETTSVLSFAAAGRIRRQMRGKRRGSGLLLFPPYAPGSLGDEAVMAASIDYLEAAGIERIGVVEYSRDNAWSVLRPSVKSVCVPWSSRLRFLRAPRDFARAVADYDGVVLIGTDVLDGLYSESDTITRLALAGVAARTGTPTSIVSFSVESPTAGALTAWRSLPHAVRLRPRDPLSAGRLQTWLGRPHELSADVAFLLRPDQASERVRLVDQWTRLQRSCGRVIVGVNANAGAPRYAPELDLEALVRLYRNTLVRLGELDEELSFILLPHDWRGTQNDEQLALALLQALPEDVRKQCLHVPGPYTAAEAKAMCGYLDLAITGRMHVAVAAIGQGVPTACIPYQDKVTGLLRHVGTENMTIDMSAATRCGSFAGQVGPAVRNRHQIRETIQAELPRLKRLAELNLTPWTE